MNGTEVKIEVLKDGYSGTVTQRALGSAPVLRQQYSGGVAGTSLAFTPECLTDGEFSQFYTSDAKEFQVDLYRSSTKIWSGFIVPELYSEPDIAPPYDVNITAADGLGELKRYDFLPVGKVTLHALFTNLLSYTGQSLNVCYISRLKYSSIAYNAFFTNTYIDLDYKAGETCYDVLQYLLATFHAQVSYYAGNWLIARENDITFDSSNRPYYITNGGAVSYFANGLMDVTSMGGGGLWPVDFTSSSVDPALRSVKVKAPWNLVSGLLNSGMTSDTSWTKSGSVTYNTSAQGYSLLPYASISQSKTQKMSKPLLLSFDAAAYIYRRNSLQQYSQAILQVTFASGGSTWYLAEDDQGGIQWSTTAATIKYRIESGDSRSTAVRNQVNVPDIYDSNEDPLTGQLSITFSADNVQGLKLFGAYLTVAAEDGYQDTININNGARGEAEEVEIAVGYETSDLSDHKDYYAGLLLDGSDNLITSLSTQNFSNLDFLALISRDYARSVALPRLRTDGTLNTPSSLTVRPLMVYYRNAYRWIETFEWDLLQDNFNFSALGIPTASLTVSSETVTPTGSASGSAENTIGRITPGGGEEGLTIMLSNYAHVFEAGANGYAYQGSDAIRVIAFRGTTAVATTIGTISGTVTGLSATPQDNGTTNASIAVSASTSLNQAGSLTIPVTVDSVTINLQYSWALAVKGSPGSTGANGYTSTLVTLYQRSATQPSTPVYNVTYYFANGNVSGADLGNWATTPPAVNANHDPLWIITGLAYGNGASATITTWNGPVKYVEDGVGTPGENGKILRGPTEWTSGFPYEGLNGTGDFIDYVFYNGDYDHLYMCLRDTSSVAPGNSYYWEQVPLQTFVATKVLYSTYGFVQNLGANAVKIQSGGGSVFGGFMPPSTDGNGDTILWAGGSTPSTATFSVDKNGVIKATAGTFSGFLQMPFEAITTACTLTSGNYYLGDKCNIYVPSYSGSLYLPCTADQIGKVVNIWDFPVKTQSSVSSFYIRTQVSGNLYIASATSSYGLQAKNYYNTGHGGYVQLIAVPGVGSADASWMVTVSACGDPVVG